MTRVEIEKLLEGLPPEWARLMKLGAAIDFGEARVIFQAGLPVRVDLAVKQVKLTGTDDELRDALRPIML
jgi:hypothetical protein